MSYTYQGWAARSVSVFRGPLCMRARNLRTRGQAVRAARRRVAAAAAAVLLHAAGLLPATADAKLCLRVTRES